MRVLLPLSPAWAAGAPLLAHQRSGALTACENRLGAADFSPPFPPAVAHRLLLSALTAAIE